VSKVGVDNLGVVTLASLLWRTLNRCPDLADTAAVRVEGETVTLWATLEGVRYVITVTPE